MDCEPVKLRENMEAIGSRELGRLNSVSVFRERGEIYLFRAERPLITRYVFDPPRR